MHTNERLFMKITMFKIEATGKQLKMDAFRRRFVGFVGTGKFREICLGGRFIAYKTYGK